MGQFARMARAQRFIDNLGELLLPTLELKTGMTCHVEEVFLASREGEGEEVVGAALLKLPNGESIVVQLPGILFDPEYSNREHMLETLQRSGAFDENRPQLLGMVLDLIQKVDSKRDS